MQLLKDKCMWPEKNHDLRVYAREYRLFYKLGAKFARHVLNGGSKILCINTKKDCLVRHNNMVNKKIHDEFRCGFFRYMIHANKHINSDLQYLRRLELLQLKERYQDSDRVYSNLYLIAANNKDDFAAIYDIKYDLARLDIAERA